MALAMVVVGAVALAVAMLGAWAGAVAVGAAMLVVEGLVALQLWRWFLEPLGLPALSLAQIIGINLLISTFTWQFGRRASENDLVARLAAWGSFMAATFAIGYIVSRFL